MKNAMQLKAAFKKIAKEKHISAQLVLQNYLLERFLERVSVSKYQSNFIIKGGFLIASMVGLDSRSTRDMDATIKRFPVRENTIQRMVEDIASINLADDVTFVLKKIGEIREGDEYTGYRVSLSARYFSLDETIKLDITTGDKITPREIDYEYRLMMEERSIHVLAYNLTTILAEKLETVISRGDQNTRPRDFYDIYILTKLQSDNIDWPMLAQAFQATAEKRGSQNVVKNYPAIIETVRQSPVMQRQWKNYSDNFEYAADISFDMVCDSVMSAMGKMA